jgi:CRP-like cAMP-binding protein
MNPKKISEKAQASHFQVDLPRRAFRRLNRAVPLLAGQPDKKEMVERMRRFGLFAKLPQKVLAELAAAAQVRMFRTGDYVWKRGEPANHAMFIDAGFVNGSRRNSEGVSRTYGLFGPGDSMGLFAIWANKIYPTDAVALNDGLTVNFVEAAALTKFAEKYPRLAGPLRTEIGHFTEAFIAKIEIVSAGTVPERLAVLMGQLVERYGVEKKGQKARLPVALTLEQLSEIVNARLETVARVLGDWKRSGWLYIDSDGFHFTRLDKVQGLLAG